ncbi:hypothetical protein [Stenotrophomonas sp. NPDC077659]|uniref:hypothetical protein n=1 Tax=Stenotrophomonas sp. NPDC077659 TaxID=3390694 RepID=UPI003D01894D
MLRSISLMIVLCCLAAAFPASAQIKTVTVTGEFRPNALDPGNTTFKNTTPRGSFCSWRPDECDRANAYIFTVGSGDFWRKSGASDSASRRDSTYVRFPPPRIITLHDAASGQSFQTKISFVAIAINLAFDRGTDPWYYGISGGCTAIRGAGGVGWSSGGWGVRDPSNPQECYSTVLRNSRNYTFRNVGLGIHVDLPNAMTLHAGRYTAEEEWTTGGAGSDIDLGDHITGVQAIRMNFVFDVIHDFQVRFPAESPRVQLAPEGGWRQWIDHGIAPASLRQELPFQLTTSMEFSLKMRCEHDAGNRCGIRNAVSRAIVPVDVDVTLPGMINQRDTRPAQFTALSPDDALAPRFAADEYLMERRSSLRFIAGPDATREMILDPGSHWAGDITLVFDANP